MRQAIRYLYKSLRPKDLRAINAYVTGEGEIFVGVVLAPKTPSHVETHALAVLGQGRMVTMHLDEFIANSLDAPETYIGIASKIFPAVKP